MKPIHVGQFSVKERAKDSYENEFDAEPRRTPEETLALIEKRRAKAKMFRARNALEKGKM